VKTIEVLDLPEDAREFVRECEVKGARTLLQRQGRPVAMLVSYDEYLALRETIEIANDADLGAMLNAAAEEEPVQWRGPALSEVEWGPEPAAEAAASPQRVWLAPSANDVQLADHERALVDEALQRIDDDPIAGAPLFDPLKGLWVYRAEHLRIVYRIVAEVGRVVVLSVTRATV